MPPDHVGNDVVDLDDPAIARHHLNPRFVARVCGPEERRALDRAGDAKRALWSAFAAKEAAFKLIVKRFGPVPFAHRAFVVEPDGRAVCYGGARFPLLLAFGPGFVHALVTDAGRAIYRVETCAGGSSSGAARALLSRLAAEILGVHPARLRVVRPRAKGHWDDLGPPRLLCDGRPAPLDVSLTHDGRFVAAAATTSAETVTSSPISSDSSAGCAPIPKSERRILVRAEALTHSTPSPSRV
jgi:phosphopantetheinyl transferase (holo-ACP synthase)